MYKTRVIADYLNYLEIEVMGRKPKVGWLIEFECRGKKTKAKVEEVGRTVLVRRVTNG